MTSSLLFSLRLPLLAILCDCQSFFLKIQYGNPTVFLRHFWVLLLLQDELQAAGSRVRGPRGEASFFRPGSHVSNIRTSPGSWAHRVLAFLERLFNFFLPYLGLWAPSPVTPLAASVCSHPPPPSSPNSDARDPSWMPPSSPPSVK